MQSADSGHRGADAVTAAFGPARA